MQAEAETTRRLDPVLALDPQQLDEHAIRALATGERMVLQIRGFVDAATCNLIAQRAEGHGYSSYLNVPSVRRIGMAYYETENKPELIEVYFERARRNIEDFRAACSPYLSPIDKLRCTLDEIWPHGANLQTLYGKKMFIGLSRMVVPDTTFLAHHDIFAQDAPGQPEGTSLKAQFGANVYIQMPQTGGALVMWEKEVAPREFDRMRGADYGVAIEALGKPDVEVTPGQGDLLIFNSRKMHAVSRGAGCNRLALSTFVGYRGEGEPLSFWS